MKTIGEEIEEYVEAMLHEKEGVVLLKNAKKIMDLNCSDELKEKCFYSQITEIILADRKIQEKKKEEQKNGKEK